ncbi:MAG: hypothetical protein Q7U66_06205 [Methylobacter sp.]|nr:hypothetical protein [Methylobacter sp.]
MSTSTIKFPHRHPNSNLFVGGDISQALDRAKAIVDLIEVACEVVAVDSYEPETLWRAAQAARFEIMDAKILLETYCDAGQSSKGEVQS